MSKDSQLSKNKLLKSEAQTQSSHVLQPAPSYKKIREEFYKARLNSHQGDPFQKINESQIEVFEKSSPYLPNIEQQQLKNQKVEQEVINCKKRKQKEEIKQISKLPILFLSELASYLDEERVLAIKVSLKNFKDNKLQDVAEFANQIIQGFFSVGNGLQLTEEKDLNKFRNQSKLVKSFSEVKKLIMDTSNFISRNKRERYLSIIAKFVRKYEVSYPELKQQKLNQALKAPLQMKAKSSDLEESKFESSDETDIVKQEVENDDEDLIRCCICYEKNNNLFISKCKHVACLQCWSQWLDKTLECPQCRGRTRKNQIFPINLEDKQKIIESYRNSQSQITAQRDTVSINSRKPPAQSFK